MHEVCMQKLFNNSILILLLNSFFYQVDQDLLFILHSIVLIKRNCIQVFQINKNVPFINLSIITYYVTTINIK